MRESEKRRKPLYMSEIKLICTKHVALAACCEIKTKKGMPRIQRVKNKHYAETSNELSAIRISHGTNNVYYFHQCSRVEHKLKELSEYAGILYKKSKKRKQGFIQASKNTLGSLFKW